MYNPNQQNHRKQTIMKIGIFKFYTILFAATLLHSANAAEEKQDLAKGEIHYSTPSKLGDEKLEKIVSVAAYDKKNSDIKKAIEIAKKIESESDFKLLNHADLAQFYSHLGWLYSQDNNLIEAIKYHTLTLDNRSCYDYQAYRFSTNQLLLNGAKANKLEEIYHTLRQKHFASLDVEQLLLIGEFYSENQRFDLAEKIFSLADEKSKQCGEYERYQYFATYIKHAVIHNRKDALEKIADQYRGENRTIKWSQLVAWKKNFPESGLPIKKTPPQYPTKALSHGISGYTIAEYTVDINGKPKDITIIEASPKGYFEKASIYAAERFMYNPLVGPDGKPLEKKARNRFTFSMRN